MLKLAGNDGNVVEAEQEAGKDGGIFCLIGTL